jgi:hypothetical protein
MLRRTYLIVGLVGALGLGCGGPAATKKESSAVGTGHISTAESARPKPQSNKEVPTGEMEVPPPPSVKKKDDKKDSKAPKDDLPAPPPVTPKKPTTAGKDQ